EQLASAPQDDRRPDHLEDLLEEYLQYVEDGTRGDEVAQGLEADGAREHDGHAEEHPARRLRRPLELVAHRTQESPEEEQERRSEEEAPQAGAREGRPGTIASEQEPVAAPSDRFVDRDRLVRREGDEQQGQHDEAPRARRAVEAGEREDP